VDSGLQVGDQLRQFNQILEAEGRAASRYDYHGICRHHIGPGRHNAVQLARGILENYPVFTPGLVYVDQLKGLAKKRMKGVADANGPRFKLRTWCRGRRYQTTVPSGRSARRWSAARIPTSVVRSGRPTSMPI